MRFQFIRCESYNQCVYVWCHSCLVVAASSAPGAYSATTSCSPHSRLAWVGWQQLESAYGSGYLYRVRCGAGGSIAHLQPPQRAQYANKQWKSRVSCMAYPAYNVTLAASGNSLALGR